MSRVANGMDVMKEKIMALKWIFSGSQLWKLVIAGLVVCSLGSLDARADLIISVVSVSVNSGTTGNPLDVELTNSGPSAVTIGGFSFGISITNPNVSFTDANISTTAAPYIFAGNSLFGPDLTGLTSGQSLETSDVFGTPNNGVSLGSGATVGIGHILFDVSAAAVTGTFPVTLAASPFSSLSDAFANDIPVNRLSPGEIAITGSVAEVPEPSTLCTLLAGLVSIVGASRLRRRV